MRSQATRPEHLRVEYPKVSNAIPHCPPSLSGCPLSPGNSVSHSILKLNRLEWESDESKAVRLSRSKLLWCLCVPWTRAYLEFGGQKGSCTNTISISSKRALLPQTALSFKINIVMIYLRIFFSTFTIRTKKQIVAKMVKKQWDICFHRFSHLFNHLERRSTMSVFKTGCQKCLDD